MSQIDLFENKLDGSGRKVVNVATVPLRSPFRYAGGKTWLVPEIRRWLRQRGGRGKTLVEPFAGGGIVSLTAAFESLVDRVIMVELDKDVAAVWTVILNGGAGWLSNAIMTFDLTVENARDAIAKADESIEARAFATIIKNRVNRGGILAEGASFVKNGENGKGISSRWYPKTLKKRIDAIDLIKEKIEFIEGDAFTICSHNKSREDYVYFIDPPYTKAGRRLYNCSEIDHEALFDLSCGLTGDFLMTYDLADEVVHMADMRQLDKRLIPMKTTHHSTKKELLLGKDLTWYD